MDFLALAMTTRPPREGAGATKLLPANEPAGDHKRLHSELAGPTCNPCNLADSHARRQALRRPGEGERDAAPVTPLFFAATHRSWGWQGGRRGPGTGRRGEAARMRAPGRPRPGC
jgi:hypothetical protein